MVTHSRRMAATVALGSALLALLAVLIRTAWQCDDAWITHRSAAHLLAGLGPVFNPGERVQAYTNPLWLGVSALCQGLSGESYYSVLAASIALAMGAAVVLATRVAPDRATGALAVLAFSASSTLVDFATGGLETPLLYLVLAVAVTRADAPAGPRDAGLAALLCSLAALTRPDAALFLAPAAAWSLWRAGRNGLPAALLGASPLLAWEAFSLVYYGSLVPNTAIAKLNLEIPPGELAARGLAWMAESGQHDPLALGLAVGGAGLALLRGSPGQRALALGSLAVLAWVVRVGGDFMLGRFLAAPALLGLGLLTRLAGPLPQPGRIALAVLLLVHALASPDARWRSGGDHGRDAARAQRLSAHGVADERAWYYPSTGLLPVLAQRDRIAAQGLPTPPEPGAVEGQLDGRTPGVAVSEQIGLYAAFAGPDLHVVDVYALADPLLARLPYRPTGPWRAGHYRRPLPDGYLASIATGQPRIRDPQVAALYADVLLLTRGPLFTRARWTAILRQRAGLLRP